jgi:hypothetical protein
MELLVVSSRFKKAARGWFPAARGWRRLARGERRGRTVVPPKGNANDCRGWVFGGFLGRRVLEDWPFAGFVLCPVTTIRPRDTNAFRGTLFSTLAPAWTRALSRRRDAGTGCSPGKDSSLSAGSGRRRLLSASYSSQLGKLITGRTPHPDGGDRRAPAADSSSWWAAVIRGRPRAWRVTAQEVGSLRGKRCKSGRGRHVHLVVEEPGGASRPALPWPGGSPIR